MALALVDAVRTTWADVRQFWRTVTPAHESTSSARMRLRLGRVLAACMMLQCVNAVLVLALCDGTTQCEVAHYLGTSVLGAAGLAGIHSGAVRVESVVAAVIVYLLAFLGVRAVSAGFVWSHVALLPTVPLCAYVSVGRAFGVKVTAASLAVLVLAFVSSIGGTIVVPPLTWGDLPQLTNLVLLTVLSSLTAFASVDHLEESTVALRARTLDAVKASRAKSIFIANISHEFRTPLQAIIAAASFLSTSELTRDDRQLVSAIVTSGDALKSLVSNIVDLSRIEAESLEWNHIIFDLFALIEEVAATMATVAQAKHIPLHLRMVVDRHSSWQFVFADPARLKQVLTNLLDNAIKFTSEGSVCLHVSCQNIEWTDVDAAPTDEPASPSATTAQRPSQTARDECGPKLRRRTSRPADATASSGSGSGTGTGSGTGLVSSSAPSAWSTSPVAPPSPSTDGLRHDDGPVDRGALVDWQRPSPTARAASATIRFQVIDTGAGIPEAFRESIFEPFAQSDESALNLHEGTGLGLCISQKFVQAMGGHIHVASQLDRGSRFWFDLNLPVRSANDTLAAILTGQSIDCETAAKEMVECGAIDQISAATPRTATGADVLDQLELWGFQVRRLAPAQLIALAQERMQNWAHQPDITACGNPPPPPPLVPRAAVRKPAPASEHTHDDGGAASTSTRLPDALAQCDIAPGETEGSVATMLSHLDVILVDELQSELQELLRCTETTTLGKGNFAPVILFLARVGQENRVLSQALTVAQRQRVVVVTKPIGPIKLLQALQRLPAAVCGYYENAFERQLRPLLPTPLRTAPAHGGAPGQPAVAAQSTGSSASSSATAAVPRKYPLPAPVGHDMAASAGTGGTLTPPLSPTRPTRPRLVPPASPTTHPAVILGGAAVAADNDRFSREGSLSARGSGSSASRRNSVSSGPSAISSHVSPPSSSSPATSVPPPPGTPLEAPGAPAAYEVLEPPSIPAAAAPSAAAPARHAANIRRLSTMGTSTQGPALHAPLQRTWSTYDDDQQLRSVQRPPQPHVPQPQPAMMQPAARPGLGHDDGSSTAWRAGRADAPSTGGAIRLASVATWVGQGVHAGPAGSRVAVDEESAAALHGLGFGDDVGARGLGGGGSGAGTSAIGPVPPAGAHGHHQTDGRRRSNSFREAFFVVASSTEVAERPEPAAMLQSPSGDAGSSVPRVLVRSWPARGSVTLDASTVAERHYSWPSADVLPDVAFDTVATTQGAAATGASAVAGGAVGSASDGPQPGTLPAAPDPTTLTDGVDALHAEETEDNLDSDDGGGMDPLDPRVVVAQALRGVDAVAAALASASAQMLASSLSAGFAADGDDADDQAPPAGTAMDHSVAAAAAMAGVPAAVPRGQLPVLIVEDNPVNLMIMKHLISKRLHLPCRVAENGQVALALWSEADFGIIFMDLQMPVMDGLTATREIRRLEATEGRPRAVIVATTGLALREDQAAALGAGCDEFLPKPIDMDQLARRIPQWLALP